MKISTTESLYRPEFERDNCGFGLMANMDGNASHWLVSTAIQALGRMTHRGAVAADGKSGDGCGLLMKKPDEFLRLAAAESSIKLDAVYGVGMVFLSQEKSLAETATAVLEKKIGDQGIAIAGWRVVPVDTSACGEESLKSLPQIRQLFVNAPAGMSLIEFERLLFIARRLTEKAIAAEDKTFYIPSLSARVISYKGLVMPKYLQVFYPDLQDEKLSSDLCVFHQRFSTNTLPQWKLAQPFRHLAHNGEINTIQGNRNWSAARDHKFQSDLLDFSKVAPLVSRDCSDSYSLDNMLEGLLAGGMDIFRAMRLLIPPAWQNVETMDASLRAFYEFQSMHMEPWDGPAGIVLTDGRYAACVLDRNGLRPARYVITKDRHITLASEIGVYEYAAEDVIQKGRLKPGQMIAADTETGKIIFPEDIDDLLRKRHPYKKWLKEGKTQINSILLEGEATKNPLSQQDVELFEKMFQVTYEERDQILRVLAENGQEAIGSMGDDTPLPVLSRRVRSPYDSFRQQFAQVTNPPIDPLRERIVMSLETCFAVEQNLFDEAQGHAKRVVVDSPVLSGSKYRQLLAQTDPAYAHEIIELNYDESTGLQKAIENICDLGEKAVRSGKVIMVLTDRYIQDGKLPIHAALATGAVHHRLVETGLRCNANIVVETGTARDPHHFAVLIGYGATAIYPYLAYKCLHQMLECGELDAGLAKSAGRNYRRGINKGLYKILSKMGISTITSYRGAQLFEAVGLNNEVVDLCFRGTTCRVQGANFEHLEVDQKTLAKDAFNKRKHPGAGGLLQYKHGGEYHAYNPDVVRALQAAVQGGDAAKYQEFADLVNNRPATSLRDLIGFRKDLEPIPLDQVEPVEKIFPRFDTAAMSLGALSPEAHESLAIAMNRLGGRSNSGEGGEDRKRFGTEKVSKIKQVASGRFGVTPEYLVNAEVLQIKVAQGAKPGEGGQLPGHKVNKMIATLRYSNPGVALISPPPHHDIYSIEDLAQLIFDLKQVNPQALVSVKLVAEAGVGTIAAGVAKAYADLITISGYDGGTGASPLTSVKYCGSPWELGLSETHQVLRANNLRSRIRLQADGGLKTGLDVVKAAILGAESFGFGTAPMIALGCKFLRICHLNNCATGIATQNKVLRKKHFIGKPEMVMNYFRFLGEEVREWMAQLGIASINELVGRTDLLELLPGDTDKQHYLDLSPVISDGGVDKDQPHLCTEERNVPYDEAKLAEQMVTETLTVIENKTGGEFRYDIRNYNRSIGARLSGEIAKRHGNLGMEDKPLKIQLAGTAGQSFGVWNAGGLHLHLAGDANDYVGKGMAGGKIVIHPPQGSEFKTNENTIIGNTCLYGATGGKLFASGLAGERFGVRNSGASAVVEGIGDHGCEYMTGGVICVLGPTGLNFGAGMTGGFAFVLDQTREFVDRYNHELIDINRIHTEHMEAHRVYLIGLIQEFVNETGSNWGQEIIDNFDEYVGKFWLVKPRVSEIETLLDTESCAA